MKYRPDLAKIKRNDDLGIWELYYDSKLISTSSSYKFLDKNTKVFIVLYKKMLYATTKITECDNNLIN